MTKLTSIIFTALLTCCCTAFAAPADQPMPTDKHSFTQGEQALLAKAQGLMDRLPERVKNRPQVAETHIPNKQIITVQQAKAMGAISYLDDNDKMLLIKGDVLVKGNLDRNWQKQLLKGMHWEGDLYDVMIDGNLTVAGDIIDDDYLYLQVTGNVICDYFFFRKRSSKY